jgi:hypothetical protein
MLVERTAVAEVYPDAEPYEGPRTTHATSLYPPRRP